MATKHTPAPWALEPAGSGHCNFGIRVKGGHVAGFAAFINTRWPNAEQQEEQLANAYLIAAAPDLLNLLSEAVELQRKHYGYAMQLHMEMAKWGGKASDAIAKATSTPTESKA